MRIRLDLCCRTADRYLLGDPSQRQRHAQRSGCAVADCDAHGGRLESFESDKEVVAARRNVVEMKCTCIIGARRLFCCPTGRLQLNLGLGKDGPGGVDRDSGDRRARLALGCRCGDLCGHREKYRQR